MRKTESLAVLSKYIVGTDIGGTFSEAVAVDLRTKEHIYSKVSSTPPSYVDGIMKALQGLGIKGSDITTFLAHGSTIGTNAIIQRTGANSGLVTTDGFRDVLLSARSDREIMYDLEWDPPPPLIKRRNILTVKERIDYEGNELVPLDTAEVARIAEVFKKRSMEAVAICFINSFINQEHEQQTKKILAEVLPNAYICASSEVLPEIREFERESTAVANAYIGPIVEKYLSDVVDRLHVWGFAGDVLVTHSGGGVMTRDVALRYPIRTCHSSPVSGAIGLGRYVGELGGYNNVITFEMGGTSTDIAMFYQGRPIMSYEWHVSFTVPVIFPAVDAVYLGAGGGSIAWIDDAGALRVGPYSAGAKPGPACYGIGGDKPTITDSQLVLSRLNPDYFLGGGIKLSTSLAKRALKTEIADHFHWSEAQAADAIVRIAVASMVEGVRMVSVKRGIDARDFCIVAYGGAGPLHAPEVARELHIPLCIIPPHPGYGSAYGALRIDFSHDFVRAIHKLESDVRVENILEAFADMEQKAAEVMRAADIPQSKVTLFRLLDVKYYDQSRPLTIEIPARLTNLSTVWKSFLAEHKKRYGYVLPEGYAEIEIMSARLRVVGKRPKPGFELARSGQVRKALKGEREVHFPRKGPVSTPIYERDLIPAGALIAGPALIEQQDSTSIVHPGMKVRVDKHGNLLIKTGA
jgi:N-methylhydantoinase A